jgi:hypothetical protein
LAQAINDLAWLWPKRAYISQANDLINGFLRKFMQNCIERDEISMNI